MAGCRGLGRQRGSTHRADVLVEREAPIAGDEAVEGTFVDHVFRAGDVVLLQLLLGLQHAEAGEADRPNQIASIEELLLLEESFEWVACRME